MKLPIHFEHTFGAQAWPNHGPHEGWGIGRQPVTCHAENFEWSASGVRWWLYTPWGALHLASFLVIDNPLAITGSIMQFQQECSR